MITLRLPSSVAQFCSHWQMPGDPQGSWRRLSSTPSAEGGGPQPPVGHSPPPQGCCGICQERRRFQELSQSVGSPSSALCEGPASGSPASWRQPAVSGHGARDQVLIGAGTRDVEPRWYGGQAGVACQGTGSGAGAAPLQQLCRGGGR